MATRSVRSPALKQRLDNRLEDVRNTPQSTDQSGILSMLGLTGLITYIGYQFGGFDVVFSDLPRFLSGQALALPRGNNVIATSLATIVLMIIASIFALLISSVMVGSTKGEHKISKGFAQMRAGNQFGTLLFIVLLEELFARGLCLGLLTKLQFLSGTVGFYALFLLGNAVWAAIHLTNFTNAKDRSLWRVLPQFVAGGLITFVFVKYGFLAGFMVHLGFDALLFSTHKREGVTGYDFAITVWSAGVAAVAYYFMVQPLGDLVSWLDTSNVSFTIAGWQFWDYFKAQIFLSNLSTMVAGVLLFDRPLTGSNKKNDVRLTVNVLMLASILITGIVFVAYWAMGFVVHDMLTRSLVVGIAFACMQRGRSGSSIARAFWFSIPSMFVSLCVMEALGFWSAIALVALGMVIQAPITWLNSKNT